ncbi:MAG: hypothetical protein NVS3B1_23620 [Marmoricola sp.]
MRISVIVPTVYGREASLGRCIAAYEATTPDIEVIVRHNHPTCASAWEHGAKAATGDALHFTADDLEPHPGWAEAAIDTIHRDAIPAPFVYRDGKLESCGGVQQELADLSPAPNISVIPFCSAEQWQWIGPHLVDAHYYTDNWFTYRARRAGFPVLVRSGYAFNHHWAQPGRGAGMSEADRMDHDRRLFEEAVRADG